MKIENMNFHFYIKDNEYVFCHSLLDSYFDGMLIETCEFGFLIKEMANADLSILLECINFGTPNTPFLSIGYLAQCKDNMIKNYSHIFSLFIIGDLIATFTDIDVDTISEDKLIEKIEGWMLYVYSLQKMAVFACDSNFDEINEIIPSLQDIKVVFEIVNGRLQMIYHTQTLLSILALDICNLQTEEFSLLKCENCGKYFTPRNRSDQIYCDNIYKDNKTCKQLGYEIKVSNDEFKKAYRSEYKTQYARINYNKHNSSYREKHFKPWNTAAKKALAEYQSRTDIDGFKEWIKEHRDV